MVDFFFQRAMKVFFNPLNFLLIFVIVHFFNKYIIVFNFSVNSEGLGRKGTDQVFHDYPIL